MAISDLPANQVVVSNQFVSQAESLSTFSSLLKNNEVAITISIDQVRGVAGLLVPGDFVNVLVAELVGHRRRATQRSATSGGATGVYTQPGPLPVPEGADPCRRPDPQAGARRDRRHQPGWHHPATNTASGMLTFAVPAEAAQKIASVDAGTFYLTLVPEGLPARRRCRRST